MRKYIFIIYLAGAPMFTGYVFNAGQCYERDAAKRTVTEDVCSAGFPFAAGMLWPLISSYHVGILLTKWARPDAA